jgi:hypothetical protein
MNGRAGSPLHAVPILQFTRRRTRPARRSLGSSGSDAHYRRRGQPSFPEFSCQKVFDERINNVSVKALLPARDDFLLLARVGSWFLACSVLAFVGSKKNDLVDEAKAAGLTTTDFRQITAGGGDHGRQRQAEA